MPLKPLTEKRLIRVNFSHTLDQDIRMRKSSKKLGISLSELINRAVEYYTTHPEVWSHGQPEPVPEPEPKPRNALVEIPKPETVDPFCPKCKSPAQLNLDATIRRQYDTYDCTSETCKWQGRFSEVKWISKNSMNK